MSSLSGSLNDLACITCIFPPNLVIQGHVFFTNLLFLLLQVTNKVTLQLHLCVFHQQYFEFPAGPAGC